MATSRSKPGRCIEPDPERPRSSSITVTDAKPAASAAFARSYCRRSTLEVAGHLGHGRLTNVYDRGAAEMVRRDLGAHPRLPVLFRQPEPPAADRPGPPPNPSGVAPWLFEGVDAPARGRAALDRGAGFSARSTSFVLEGLDCAPRLRFALSNARTLANSLRPSMLTSGAQASCPSSSSRRTSNSATRGKGQAARPRDARQFLAATKRRDLQRPSEQRMPTIGNRRQTETGMRNVGHWPLLPRNM